MQLEGQEREAPWDTAVDTYRGHAVYAETTHPRVIRVFRLEPVGAAD